MFMPLDRVQQAVPQAAQQVQMSFIRVTEVRSTPSKSQSHMQQMMAVT